VDEDDASDEDLVIRTWDGDESVLGEMLMAFAEPIQTMIRNRYHLSESDAEDAVAEAFRRFWEYRDNYDGSRDLRAYVYRIADKVACNLVTGHLKWQKSRLAERRITDQIANLMCDDSNPIEAELDTIEESQSGICKAVKASMRCLSDIQQAVLKAYAFAVDGELDAGILGIELGERFHNGVAIPAGTIRQHKFRGKELLTSEMRKRGYELKQIGVMK
jgi:DNA-directed RNA polymerase specialized sigma24 family protein